MTADMHRARHLAWELPSLGWEVEILCPDASYQNPLCMDGDSAEFFPSKTIVHAVPQRFSWVSRALGFGGIGWRALLPMLVTGCRLLRSGRFDLVYFSTTQVPVLTLGTLWRRLFGVPFVLDIQDPFYKEGSATPVWSRPSLKHLMAHRLAKAAETISVPSAAGIVAVSPAYIETLKQRYARRCPEWIDSNKHSVIPFPVSFRDLREVSRHSTSGKPDDANLTRSIAYVGAGGPIMARSFSLLCEILAQLRNREPALFEGLRLDLRGTMMGWQQGDPKHLLEVATKQGIGDLVHEDPQRVSFRKSIELLLSSDGAIVLGIENDGYMPSKLFSYAGSKKPIMAVVHRDSPAFEQFQATPTLGHALWFDGSGQEPMDEALTEVESFIREVADRREFDRESVLTEFAAPSMARRHADLFEACVRLGSIGSRRDREAVEG
jgi:hypothetical protein